MKRLISLVAGLISLASAVAFAAGPVPIISTTDLDGILGNPAGSTQWIESHHAEGCGVGKIALSFRAAEGETVALYDRTTGTLTKLAWEFGDPIRNDGKMEQFSFLRNVKCSGGWTYFYGESTDYSALGSPTVRGIYRAVSLPDGSVSLKVVARGPNVGLGYDVDILGDAVVSIGTSYHFIAAGTTTAKPIPDAPLWERPLPCFGTVYLNTGNLLRRWNADTGLVQTLYTSPGFVERVTCAGQIVLADEMIGAAQRLLQFFQGGIRVALPGAGKPAAADEWFITDLAGGLVIGGLVAEVHDAQWLVKANHGTKQVLGTVRLVDVSIINVYNLGVSGNKLSFIGRQGSDDGPDAIYEF